MRRGAKRARHDRRMSSRAQQVPRIAREPELGRNASHIRMPNDVEPRIEASSATASASSDTMATHTEAGIRFQDGHDLDHTQTKLDLKRDARAATEKEQTMSLMEGIRQYPKAIGWSMLISTCIVMEGYQVCLLSNFCEYSLDSTRNMLVS